jgi:predicted RNA-binding Zn-ribbon protein involved in translation (DUF1610 family)
MVLGEKNMKLLQSRIPFILLLLLSCAVFVLALYDIYYDKNWLQTILALYGILIILTIVFLFIEKKKPVTNVQDTAKTFGGELHHFKCPTCQGIFAVKKSTQKNTQPFTLTCPNCGTVGTIAPKSKLIVEKIPEEKSPSMHFQCTNCGERVKIWAEGTDNMENVKIFTCPSCKTKGSLKPL